MRDLVINSTVQHTLLILVPFIFALILKMARLRAWSVVGGILGGVILGPTVFGSVAPEYWEGLFRGGVLEHQLLLSHERQQEADVLAAVKLGADEPFIAQLRASQQYDREPYIERWKLAQWSDQRTLRDYAMALIFLTLLSGHLRCRAKGTAPPLMSLSVGVWSAILPGGVISLIAYHYWDATFPAAIAFGACLGVGPWTLTRWEQRSADQTEEGGAMHMLRCGRIAWLVASALGVYSTWQQHGAMAMVWMLPLLLYPLVWLMRPRPWRWLTAFVDHAAIPSIVAIALVLIDPFESFLFWPSLCVVLLCADARWLGGVIGLSILGGRNGLRVMRLSIPLVDAGISQLCIAVLLLNARVLPEGFAIAAIIGVLFLELTAPMRFQFAVKPMQDQP